MRLEILWRQLVSTGSEHLVLELNGGIHADSLSVGEVDNRSYRVRYQIDCTADWLVQRINLEDLLSGQVRSCR